MRKCSKCGCEHDRNGSYCKPCHAKYQNEWNAKNAKRVAICKQCDQQFIGVRCRECEKKYISDYYAKYPAKLIESSRKNHVRNKRGTERHNARRREYERHRRLANPRARISQRISSAIRKSLRTNKGGRRWETLVGYTLDQLIDHLKTTIPEGYEWQDYINGVLQVDHEIPISVHNFTSHIDTDFLRCWSLSNLRLMTAKENSAKSNKLTSEFQPTLF